MTRQLRDEIFLTIVPHTNIASRFIIISDGLARSETKESDAEAKRQLVRLGKLARIRTNLKVTTITGFAMSMLWRTMDPPS